MSLSDAMPILTFTAAEYAYWLSEATAGARAWISSVGFEASAGKFAIVPEAHQGKAAVIVICDLKSDPLWSLAALPEQLPQRDYTLATDVVATTLRQVWLGWQLGAYQFNRYKTPKRGPARLIVGDALDLHVEKALVDGVVLARTLINTPAEDMGPSDLLEVAQGMGRAHGATVRAIQGAALETEGYPSIYRVGRASNREPILIDIAWGDATHPAVTLVGKGICFDTGGLNLKAQAPMSLMKKDMGGAAIMLGLAQCLMAVKAPVRLRVLIPAADNAVSGSSMRPRDIIRTRSGKTVEITNTDAEGRLVLADALFEASQDKPALIIDAATLTGAARQGLGPALPALFTDHDELVAQLLEAGRASFDPLWRLPLWKPYRFMIESRIADLVNSADSVPGDAIAAALFLAEFVPSEIPWAHLDVMAYNTRALAGRPEGGEATALRALYSAIRARFG